MLYHDPGIYLAIYASSQAERRQSLERATAIGAHGQSRNSRATRSALIRIVALVIGAAIAASACGGAAARPTSRPEPPAPEGASANERAALQVARAFLSALEGRDTETVFSLMAPTWQTTSGRDFADRLGGTAAVTVFSLEIDRSRPIPANSVMVAVTLDVVPKDDASPWNHGVATRFLLMTGYAADWRAAGFGG
ncbi:MAG: hypothetical protein AB7T37_17465 [Dehalococcoidia bacterium]